MASHARPDFIDLGSSRPWNLSRDGTPSPRELHSPRSGDVPPALSPLDAFALQGRMLAARFEEQDGKRISRLPPLTIANELAKPRPGYFHTPKSPASSGEDYHTSASPPSGGSEPSGASGESLHVFQPDPRHRSFYPFIQSSDGNPLFPAGNELLTAPHPTLPSVSEERSPPMTDNHPFARSESPDDFYKDSAGRSRAATTSKIDFAPEPSRKGPTNESLKTNGPISLAPPKSPVVPRSPRAPPSIRSVRNDSGDDSDALSFRSDPYDFRQYERKPSTTSVRGRQHSPFSPSLPARRSPSISSEFSTNESGHVRRSVNFSRPMSPSTNVSRMQRPSIEQRPSFESSTKMLHADSPEIRPSMDVISVQESIDSPQLRPSPSEERPSEEVIQQERKPENDASAPNAATSYIYAKYALPRGRVVSRNSIPAGDWLNQRIEWDQPASKPESRPAQQPETQTPTQIETPRTQEIFRNGTQQETPSAMHETPDVKTQTRTGPREPGKFREDFQQEYHEPADQPERPSHISRISHTDIISTVPSLPRVSNKPVVRRRSKSVDESLNASVTSPVKKPSNPSLHRRKPNSSFDSNELPKLSVDKSRRKHKDTFESITPFTPDQISPEAHLAKGISCHESGSLQKSTYHLRLAARAGNPTAMLLYALACRHGWGMRANQAEGVLWLRKAVDAANLDVNDPQALATPNMNSVGPLVNGSKEERTHQSRLALSIYELGVSYMNGWGVAQDKALALRCFDIAGSWGDADALAEAGFCYTKGVGCKKNLHKAAALYRRAEEKGISMAGNSW